MKTDTLSEIQRIELSTAEGFLTLFNAKAIQVTDPLNAKVVFPLGPVVVVHPGRGRRTRPTTPGRTVLPPGQAGEQPVGELPGVVGVQRQGVGGGQVLAQALGAGRGAPAGTGSLRPRSGRPRLLSGSR